MTTEQPPKRQQQMIRQSSLYICIIFSFKSNSANGV